MEVKDEERMAMIPLILHELDMARIERCHESDMKEVTKANEKLTAVIKGLIIVIFALVVAIGIGVYEFMGCDFTDTTVDSEDDGIANYLEAGTSGVINNAEDHGKKENTQKD